MSRNFKISTVVLLVVFLFSVGISFASEYSVDDVKNNYFLDYPESKGYASIGEAFNEFFGEPEWEIDSMNVGDLFGDPKWGSDIYVVVFKGIALFNGNRARFTISFKLNDSSGNDYTNDLRIHSININNQDFYHVDNQYNAITDGDLLAAIYLN